MGQQDTSEPVSLELSNLFQEVENCLGGSAGHFQTGQFGTLRLVPRGGKLPWWVSRTLPNQSVCNSQTCSKRWKTALVGQQDTFKPVRLQVSDFFQEVEDCLGGSAGPFQTFSL